MKLIEVANGTATVSANAVLSYNGQVYRGRAAIVELAERVHGKPKAKQNAAPKRTTTRKPESQPVPESLGAAHQVPKHHTES